MKKLLFIIFFSLFYFQSRAQLGITFHKSYLPFMGLNYQLGERFIPEYRVALNRLNSFTDMQLKLNYILKQKENYQLYTGLGGYYTNDLAKLGVSGGINIYPFKTKDFGFHMEISALFDSAGILKGGWGMQYRFLRSE